MDFNYEDTEDSELDNALDATEFVLREICMRVDAIISLKCQLCDLFMRVCFSQFRKDYLSSSRRKRHSEVSHD